MKLRILFCWVILSNYLRGEYYIFVRYEWYQGFSIASVLSISSWVSAHSLKLTRCDTFGFNSSSKQQTSYAGWNCDAHSDTWFLTESSLVCASDPSFRIVICRGADWEIILGVWCSCLSCVPLASFLIWLSTDYRIHLKRSLNGKINFNFIIQLSGLLGNCRGNFQ